MSIFTENNAEKMPNMAVFSTFSNLMTTFVLFDLHVKTSAL